jgi:site-specific recombinase XerD
MDYLTEFRDFLEAERVLEPNSIEGYMNDLDGFLDWSTPMGEPFSGALAESYLKYLQRSLHRKESYLRHIRMAIRRFYHWLAVHQKAICVDEIDKIDPIRHAWEHLPTLTWEEVQKLMGACEGEAAERNRTIILLMFMTGMRVSEVCNLDLDSLLPGMKALRITAKGKVDRVVPVTDECFTALQDYARRWRTRHAVNTPAVFVNERSRNGQRMKRRRVSGLIARLAKKVGVVGSSAHTLRRSRATQLLNAGVPVKEVQEFLGQRSIDATERYITTTAEKIREVYNRCRPQTKGPEET